MLRNSAIAASARSRSSFALTLSLAMTSFKGPPMFWTLLSLFLLLSIPTALTHGNSESWHNEMPFFLPPDPSRPCRHAFRDDPETSALLADFVVIGRPTPTYRHSPGVLYNASVLVEQVLKRPRLSIYPVREGYPILTGPFSQWSDLGRCWINVHPARKYVFFIDRPNWVGFFRISQLPLVYTAQRWQKIRAILNHPPSPLQMRSLHHQESLRVQQGEEVVLSCVVTGRPAPLISWYVNNTQQLGLWNVATGRGVTHKTKRKSRLHLSNMQPVDSGNYSCLAENVNGYIKKTVEIYVVPRPQTTPRTWTTPVPVKVHPCYRYCLHGYCNLVDGRPSCSCISQYYGTRCELAEKPLEETKSIKLECTTGCDQFFGRLVLFSTLGALLSLLLLIIVCLFVRRKSQPSIPRNSPRAIDTPAQSSIPLDFLDASDPSPGSFSHICTSLNRTNSYIESPELVQQSAEVDHADISVTAASLTAIINSHLLTPPLPLGAGIRETSRHLPQLTF